MNPDKEAEMLSNGLKPLDLEGAPSSPILFQPDALSRRAEAPDYFSVLEAIATAGNSQPAYPCWNLNFLLAVRCPADRMRPRVGVVAALGCLLLAISLSLAQESEARREQRQHFVLVHGTGHGAWCWYKVATLLRRAGHRVAAMDLASNGIHGTPADEVNSLAQYSQPLVDYLQAIRDDEMVTLVGHSLGGCSISYAMEMFPAKVSKAIFIAAFTPLHNQSFLGSAHPEVFARLVANGVFVLKHAISGRPTSASIALAYAKSYLYNESPEEDVTLALSLLTPTPYPMSEELLSLSQQNYGRVRRFYIVTMKDRLFFAEHQHYSVAQNPPEAVFRLHASDHSPFFSHPQQLCNLLIHIATL